MLANLDRLQPDAAAGLGVHVLRDVVEHMPAVASQPTVGRMRRSTRPVAREGLEAGRSGSSSATSMV